MNLAEVTTLRLGGPARDVIEATSERVLVETVRIADEAADPILVVGGGSNLVVADEGFDGLVVLVRTRGIVVQDDGGDVVAVTVAAGEDWDAFVARAVSERWVGVEALSGIPGSTGATPIQNVGAYGQEVAQTIASVRVFDRYDRRIRIVDHAECGFDYRWSAFKAQPLRYVVLSVTFRFRRGELSTPIAYAELARSLGVELGERADAARVREAVLALRRGKGMVLDPNDHDTWSAGSFFTNPVLDVAQAEQLPPEAPRFPQSDGRIKTSAAWLIDRAGFSRGHGSGAVSLSTKHPLALTHRGGGSARELLALAREVRDEVERRFGIRLVNEPVLVGLEL